MYLATDLHVSNIEGRYVNLSFLSSMSPTTLEMGVIVCVWLGKKPRNDLCVGVIHGVGR